MKNDTDNPFGLTALESKAPSLSSLSANDIFKSMDNFKSVKDLDLLNGPKKKKKKKKKTSRLIHEGKESKFIIEVKKPQSQLELEKSRIVNTTIAVLDVPDKDKNAFVKKLDEAKKEVRNFLLKDLAPTQMAVMSGLDQALQELNIIMDGGVNSTSVSLLRRITDEVSSVVLIERLCRLFGASDSVTAQLVSARIEHFKPRDTVGTKVPGDDSRPPVGNVRKKPAPKD